MSKNDADEAVSVVSLTSSCGGYINGRHSANLELLIDKTSSIYLYIRVITKLPNSEQSYKGKVKTHKYINRQNQSTTGKL